MNRLLTLIGFFKDELRDNINLSTRYPEIFNGLLWTFDAVDNHYYLGKIYVDNYPLELWVHDTIFDSNDLPNFVVMYSKTKGITYDNFDPMEEWAAWPNCKSYPFGKIFKWARDRILDAQGNRAPRPRITDYVTEVHHKPPSAIIGDMVYLGSATKRPDELGTRWANVDVYRKSDKSYFCIHGPSSYSTEWARSQCTFTSAAVYDTTAKITAGRFLLRDAISYVLINTGKKKDVKLITL